MYHLLKWIKFSVKKLKFKIYWKNGEKNTGKVREIYHSGKVGTMNTLYIIN